MKRQKLKAEKIMQEAYEKTGVTMNVRKGFDGGWQPEFTVGVQTFYLEEQETKALAWWYCENLAHLFINTAPQKFTGKDLAVALFKIHSHGEIVTGDEIVYREKDLIPVLKTFGLPEPDFKNLTEKDFTDDNH